MEWIKSRNPVYIYTMVGNAIAVLIAFGVIMWTDIQRDLVLGLVATIILVFTGVSIPAAKGVSNVAQDSYNLGVKDGTLWSDDGSVERMRKDVS